VLSLLDDVKVNDTAFNLHKHTSGHTKPYLPELLDSTFEVQQHLVEQAKTELR
jgi:hypothetical protein